jgi:hypothetical protein
MKMQIDRILRIVIITLFLIGSVFPFSVDLVVIEMFYLLLPLIIIFLASLIYLIISIFNKFVSVRTAFYIFLLVPTFFISQLISRFSVDRIQRFRSEILITDIENFKKNNGVFPDNYETPMGIYFE